MLEDWAEADQALEDFKTDVPSLIEKDFREAGCSTEYHATIYHYTDLKGALGILQTGQLWFTERAHLNDPTEIQYGLYAGRELFERAAEGVGPKTPKDAALHLKGEHHFGLSSYGFWIASFSLNGNDLGQWRSYADDGRGVCLGFSTRNFDMVEIAKRLPYAPNSLRFPINYEKSILCQRLLPYVNRSLDILQKADLPARKTYYEPRGRALLYERDLFHVLNNGFYANALLSKHPAYEHEQEYRLLISGVRNTISTCGSHHLRERMGEIVGYLTLPIPRWMQPGVLTHIRVGPAAPRELADQIRMTLTTLGLPLPEMEKSDIPYRSLQ
jgi:Protein of unknown function (DUF2971)